MNKININFLFIFFFFSAWGVLIYSNTFHASFHLDDYLTIVNNEYIHWNDLSVNKIKFFLSGEAAADDRIMYGRPLSYLTFGLNYYLGALDVWGYHVFNMTIHIITGFLLYIFLYQTLKLPVMNGQYKVRASWIALISSTLWFSSPVQTEAVTYIVQRMTSMSSMFYVLSLIFFVRWRTSTSSMYWIYPILMGLSFLSSIGSKPIAITLPVVIVLYEICFFQRGRWGDLARSKIVFLVLIIMAILLFAVVDFQQYLPYGKFSIKERIYTESRVIIYYITLLLFPFPERMSLYYDYPLSRTLLDPITTIISLAVLSFISIAAVLNIRKRPLQAFLSLWFLLAVSAGSAAVRTELIFEHRLYLPSMAFFPFAVITGVSVFEGKGDFARKILVATLILVVAAYSINTYMRNSKWVDGYSIHSDSVRKYPENLLARLNLGVYYLNNEMYDDAISHLKRAVELHPRKGAARLFLGMAYYHKKFYVKAIKELEISMTMVDFEKLNYDFFTALGNSYIIEGRFKDAEGAFKEALRLAPNKLLHGQISGIISGINKKDHEVGDNDK